MKRIYCILSFLLIAFLPIHSSCDFYYDDILVDKIELLVSLGVVSSETTPETCDYVITRREAFRIACNARGGVHFEEDLVSKSYLDYKITDVFGINIPKDVENNFDDIDSDDQDYYVINGCYLIGLISGKEYQGKKLADLDSPLTESEMNYITLRIAHDYFGKPDNPCDSSSVTKDRYLSEVYDALYKTYIESRYSRIRQSRPIDDLIKLKYAETVD